MKRAAVSVKKEKGRCTVSRRRNEAAGPLADRVYRRSRPEGERRKARSELRGRLRWPERRKGAPEEE